MAPDSWHKEKLACQLAPWAPVSGDDDDDVVVAAVGDDVAAVAVAGGGGVDVVVSGAVELFEHQRGAVSVDGASGVVALFEDHLDDE